MYRLILAYIVVSTFPFNRNSFRIFRHHILLKKQSCRIRKVGCFQSLALSRRLCFDVPLGRGPPRPCPLLRWDISVTQGVGICGAVSSVRRVASRRCWPPLNSCDAAGQRLLPSGPHGGANRRLRCPQRARVSRAGETHEYNTSRVKAVGWPHSGHCVSTGGHIPYVLISSQLG